MAETTDILAARDLYLRASAVFLPIDRSPASHRAWQYGKDAYMAASPYLDPPNREIAIPHTHQDLPAGDKDTMYSYLRIPSKIQKPECG
ncbi:hypothetical protein N7488_002364 [Penicillium malachiteum]|nr:hypothetical protein N7488_002364 [Penicillium malachiteum]